MLLQAMPFPRTPCAANPPPRHTSPFFKALLTTLLADSHPARVAVPGGETLALQSEPLRSSALTGLAPALSGRPARVFSNHRRRLRSVQTPGQCLSLFPCTPLGQHAHLLLCCLSRKPSHCLQLLLLPHHRAWYAAAGDSEDFSTDPYVPEGRSALDSVPVGISVPSKPDIPWKEFLCTMPTAC